MAKLQALVQHTSRKIATRAKDRPLYLQALALFWQGQAGRMIEFVSEQLLAGVDPQTEAALYRLWLEQLAQNKEQRALRALTQHLFKMGRLHNTSSWLGLRALAYLELDDWQACQLYASAVMAVQDDPYCMEFTTRYRLRTAEPQSALTLPNVSSGLFDYWHWQMLAQVLLVNNRREDLDQILTLTSELFPDSPLEDNFGLHLLAESGNFRAAAHHSQRLTKRYPQNLDYLVADSYLRLQAGQVSTALLGLEKARTLSGGQADSDVTALLAHCYAQRAAASTSPTDERQAQLLARRARRQRRLMGLPVEDLLVAPLMGTEYDTDEKSSHDPQTLMVRLSERRAAELLRGDEEALASLTLPLGRQAGTHDLVFFVRERQDQTRILALYAVASPRRRHATLGQVHTLTLLKRFAEPVTAKINTSDLVPVKAKRGFGRLVEGVYRLGDGGFDAIAKAVRVLVDDGERLPETILTLAKSS